MIRILELKYNIYSSGDNVVAKTMACGGENEYEWMRLCMRAAEQISFEWKGQQQQQQQKHRQTKNKRKCKIVVAMRRTWNNVTCDSIKKHLLWIVERERGGRRKKRNSKNRRMRLLWPPLDFLHRLSQQRCVLFIHNFFVSFRRQRFAYGRRCMCVCIELDAMRIRVWFSLTRWAYVIPTKMSKRVLLGRQPCQCDAKPLPYRNCKKIELHVHILRGVGGCVRVRTHLPIDRDRCTEGDYYCYAYLCMRWSDKYGAWKCIGPLVSLWIFELKKKNDEQSENQCENCFNLIYGHFCVWVNKTQQTVRVHTTLAANGQFAIAMVKEMWKSKKSCRQCAGESKSSRIDENTLRSKSHRNKRQTENALTRDRQRVCSRVWPSFQCFVSLYRFVHEYFMRSMLLANGDAKCKRKKKIEMWTDLIWSILGSFGISFAQTSPDHFSDFSYLFSQSFPKEYICTFEYIDQMRMESIGMDDS